MVGVKKNEENKSSGSGQASAKLLAAPAEGGCFDMGMMAETAYSEDSRKGEGCSAAGVGSTHNSANKNYLIKNDVNDFVQSQQKALTFPQQLMILIEKETVDENTATINGQKAIEWLPTGDKFIIRDKLTLEEVVLPKYFSNKCKFTSFVRKLYRWGFRQLESNYSGTIIFRHKNFIRGDTQRCLAMRSIVRRYSAPPIIDMDACFESQQRCGEVVGRFPNANVGYVMANEILHSNHQAMYSVMK